MNEPLDGSIAREVLTETQQVTRELAKGHGDPLAPILGEVCCLDRCPWCQVLIAIPRSRYNEHARYACEPCGKAELERIRQRAATGNELIERLARGERRRG